MNESRISSGIRGLDNILKGGFKPASSYLVVGGPGTGKTVMSLQFLSASTEHKSRCLYFSFAEPVESLRKNAALLGWDLAGVEFVDFTKEDAGNGTSGEYSVFPTAEVEHTPIYRRIYDAVEQYDPQRLVIDSATFLGYLSSDEYQYRKHIQRLVNHLSQRGCLSLLLFEPTELEKEAVLALAADGVIYLHNDVSTNRAVEIRSVEVKKLRGSPFLSGRHPFRIDSHGITVWPHRIEKLKKDTSPRTTLSSGVEGIDHLLGGGVPSGSCTLITGPTGIGKSTLADQFLVTAAQAGAKGVIYTFDEGGASIVDRCRSISIPIEECLEKGLLTIREINPLELYPDEFLDLIRHDVQQQGVQLLLIDSLRGYNLAMEEFGSMTAHMQNLVNFARRVPVSVFLIYEQERLSGDLQLTELGVSYLTDNILLLRLVEERGRIIRVMGCLKKRLGSFSSEARELIISPEGLAVGQPIAHTSGLLSAISLTSNDTPGPHARAPSGPENV